MNAGLAFLILTFFFLPGIVFVLTLLSSSDSSEDASDDNDFIDDSDSPPAFLDANWKVVSFVLISSISVHIILQGALDLLSPHSASKPIDLELVGALLSGSEVAHFDSALENLHTNRGLVVLYFTAACILAVVAGRNTKGSFASPAINWLETEIEELINVSREDQSGSQQLFVIWVTVAKFLDGDVWLYSGFYKRHENNEKGEPELIFIIDARRRRLSDDNEEGRWKKIPGESFSLRLTDMDSVNLDYIALESAEST